MASNPVDDDTSPVGVHDPLPRLGLILLAAVTLGWGSSWAAMKTVLMEMSPWGFRTISILPAGHPHEFATELLASRRMAEAATRLAEAVPDRIVIFDSPPLLVTSESRVLASRMGQIVLVVCAGKTPQQAVVSAVDSLDSSKAINVILNQAGTILGEGGYGGYGYGYGVTS